MNGQYNIGDIVLGNWMLTSLIGEGSFGCVFEARRDEFGREYKAAVKIITIPQGQSDISNAIANGLELDSVTTYPTLIWKYMTRTAT